MFTFLFKPKIKAKLIKKGSAVKVSVINSKPEQTIIILFLTIKQVAKGMGLEFRQLMNNLIDIDKTVVKSQNRERKEHYKQEQKAKHQK